MRGHRAYRGSTDALEGDLTGWEWLKMLNYMSNKLFFAGSLILSLISSTSHYVMGIYQGQLATVLVSSDYETPDEMTADVNAVCLKLVLVMLTFFFIGLLKGFMQSKSDPIYLRDLRLATFNGILAQDVEFFDERHTGLLVSRVVEDAGQAADAFSSSILSIILNVFEWVTGLFVCLTQSWRGSLVAVATMPLMAGLHAWRRKRNDALYLELTDKRTTVSTLTEEILTNFRVVKAMDAEMREYHHYTDGLMDMHATSVRKAIVDGVDNFVNTLIHQGGNVAQLFVTGWEATAGLIEPGNVYTIHSVMMRWAGAFTSLIDEFTQVRKANVAAAKLLQILDNHPKIGHDNGRALTRRVTGRIEFRNVVFRYPGREENALDGLSFTINAGETVAIVGESGCGKSTTLALMQRFYDPAEGEVFLDDMNLHEYRPRDIRAQIAMVPQSPAIFSLPVRDNIRLGKVQAGRNEVREACRAAAAHDFIVQLSDRYKTPIHKNNLSGGQKQRVCLARALLLNAPILLLDEATASLDSESERLVQESLSRVRGGRTIVLVAHRLATVQHADRILVMARGKVVEEGTHEALLAAGGAYAELVQHQLV